MIRSGVTSFADMYYFEADVATATVEAGLRAVLGETVLKFPSPDAETYEDSLKYARDFLDQWREHPLITAAVAPHAPYSNTEEILRECVELALEYDAPLIIHLAETRREVDDNIREHDEAVIQWMESIDLFQSKVLAAHCVHIDEMEIRILREHGVHVAHCPSANLKLASGIAPVSQMLARPATTILICSRKCAWQPCWQKQPPMTQRLCRPGRRFCWRLGREQPPCSWMMSPAALRLANRLT
jgi:5-methylthioadenosine/S-adenosylhomocysteine deaminase